MTNTELSVALFGVAILIRERETMSAGRVVQVGVGDHVVFTFTGPWCRGHVARAGGLLGCAGSLAGGCGIAMLLLVLRRLLVELR